MLKGFDENANYVLYLGQIFLPRLRNCSMEFIKDILCGKKKYFLQKDILWLRVPMCPELTVDKVMMQVKEHNQVMAYLPDLPLNGKLYVERDFLFAIVNTVDKNYFREALAEIETRRTTAYGQPGSGLIEIDKDLLELLESMQSRMSA